MGPPWHPSPSPLAAQVPASDASSGLLCHSAPHLLLLQGPPCSLEDDEVFLGNEARPSTAQADPFRHCSVEELYELLETLGR